MKQVLCSILIPVYNGEKFIGKTIQSCLHQTLVDEIQIIAVDDYSQDSSFEIIQKLSTDHSNLITLKNESNLGINKSINIAATLAKGKYLMFLGHDDMLPPKHIETMIKEFDENTSFVHCNSNLIDMNDEIIGTGVNDTKQLIRTRIIKYYLSISNAVHSTGTVIRKKSFDEVGGWDEQYRNYGEWLLWIKLSSVGNVKYNTKTKALYRKHATNITNTFSDNTIKPELFSYFEKCQKTALLNIHNPIFRFIVTTLITIKKYKQSLKTKV